MGSGVDIADTAGGPRVVADRSAGRVAVAPVATRGRRPGWRRTLRRAVVVVDLTTTAAVSTAAVLIGTHGTSRPWEPLIAVPLAALGFAVVAAALAAFRVWEPVVLGEGAEEFNRIYRAVLFSLVVMALGGLALKADVVRPWVFGVLPAMGIGLVAGRGLVRVVLHRGRRRAAFMSSVLAVGTAESVDDLVARARRAPQHGWQVVAACTPTAGADGDTTIAGVPVVGDLDDVREHARAVDVVAVAPAPGWTARRLHRLAWELEGSGVELVVDPGLMEIGGPRLRMSPVDGLPLLRLTEPKFSGFARILKGCVDRAMAVLLIVVLAPLFVGVALVVRAEGGPVLFRQTRVGRGGRTFRMVKFRSMVPDAEVRRSDLVPDDPEGPLFKLRADPRVTRSGAVLRRFSLDELPQLFNVLAGSMSLVGPRPPLADEVASYTDDARRKLLVRPGMTGLWQVNGRSDLSWDESVRLDLRYVENWSPALDVLVLAKTVGAVVRGRGAY